MALYLTEQDVAAVLTMDIALEEVERGFVHLAQGKAFNFPRKPPAQRRRRLQLHGRDGP